MRRVVEFGIQFSVSQEVPTPPAGARVYNVAMGVQKPSGLPYALISV